MRFEFRSGAPEEESTLTSLIGLVRPQYCAYNSRAVFAPTIASHSLIFSVNNCFDSSPLATITRAERLEPSHTDVQVSQSETNALKARIA